MPAVRFLDSSRALAPTSPNLSAPAGAERGSFSPPPLGRRGRGRWGNHGTPADVSESGLRCLAPPSQIVACVSTCDSVIGPLFSSLTSPTPAPPLVWLSEITALLPLIATER